MRAFTAWLVLGVAAVVAAGPSVSVTPSVLDEAGWANVTFAGVTAPAADDQLAIFVGNHADPIGWLDVSHISGWGSGAGGPVPLQFYNMHLPAVVAYVQGGKRLAQSQPVQFASNISEVHLALADDETSTVVSWTTADGDGSFPVRWGTSASPSGLASTAASTTQSYTAGDLLSPANSTGQFLSPGTLHTAVMKHGFSTPTRVYYQVGGAGGSWSSVRSFVTAAVPGGDVDTSLVVYGDLGVSVPFVTKQEQQPPSALVLSLIGRTLQQRVDAGKPTTVLHIGDISYARGFAWLWPAFMHQIQAVASSATGYLVGIGNHEYDYKQQPFRPSWSDYGSDSGGEQGVPYTRRFSMPTRNGGEKNLWYSTDVGNIHVSVLSSEHNFTQGSVQLKWLAADLAAVDRTVTPFVVVSLHRPLYSSSGGHDIGIGTNLGGMDDHLRAAIQPLLRRHNVSMLIAGHVHVYERTCAMVGNFTCATDATDGQGTVHLTAGCAGNVYNPNWASSLQASPALQNAGHHDQPAWSIFRTQNFGYVQLDTNSTHLTATFYGAQRGMVHDYVAVAAPKGL